MKALILTGKNQPLLYKEVPNPFPTKGEVVVSLKAAALNHRDVWISKGLYPGIKYPAILGSDGAGFLEDKKVIINPSIQWGDQLTYQSSEYRILGLPDDGTFAELVIVDKEQIFDMPAHLSFEQASVLPLAGLTAYRALFTRCKLKKGEKVLITGIGGGVALFALQFALAAKAEVYVTSGKEEKIEKAVQHGAGGGVNYKEEGWSKKLMKLEKGFDVIIDGAGGAGFSHLLKVANTGARICVYGGTAGKITNISPQLLFWKQASVLGSTMGSPEDFKNMLHFVKKHRIVPIIDRIYSLAEGNKAFKRMANSEQFGKIVLSV
ncbi:MAG: zinc-binding dehydrogenase [Bacteroidetes bacterium]|nr:zinc-binding dehydrogenase [Bacteroidota bacterium]